MKRNEDQLMYEFPVTEMFQGRRRQAGEVGIEIECEGRNLVLEPPEMWETHEDGSLRGESKEYVLKKPLKRNEVNDALMQLYAQLKAESRVAESYRTSVHVHINQQGQSVKQLYNYICLYLLMENLLVEHAGPDRVGNLFCLRAEDAEFLLSCLRDAVRSNNYNILASDNLRYASCNVTALSKYNSLEFRALRGTIDPAVIQGWVDTILALKDASGLVENPRKIIEMFSAMGPEAFMQWAIPDDALRAPLIKLKGWQDRLLQGARLVQPVAYAVEWTGGLEYSVEEKKGKTKINRKPVGFDAWGEIPVAVPAENGGIRFRAPPPPRPQPNQGDWRGAPDGVQIERYAAAFAQWWPEERFQEVYPRRPRGAFHGIAPGAPLEDDDIHFDEDDM